MGGRVDAEAKARGTARFIDDLRMPGMKHGVTVRSPAARGRLRGVHFGAGVDWDAITVVTSRDVPGRNRVALVQDDQPFLVEDEIRHAGEPVALLAHEDRALLERARALVKLEVEELPPRLDAWSGGDAFRQCRLSCGEVERGLAEADVVLEGEYGTAAVDQLYLEPQGAIAQADEAGVTVWGSLQCPFYVHKALKMLFGFGDAQVRVVQCETGGGFGGKEDYPSILAGHAALLARKCGAPVKMIYDRAEDLAATTKRHPSRTRIRAGVRNDGTLTALDIDFRIDAGAYLTLSPVVLSRGTIHAPGVYRCPNVRVTGTALRSNHPPYGAFRGFGVPQSIFALERHIDRLARAVKLNPAEFRRRNFLRPGDTMATGQRVPEGADLEGLLDRALLISGYQERARRPGAGMGVAAFLHGSGFTGAGEVYLKSKAGVEIARDARVRVLAASAELGQGARTVLCQLAAEQLGAAEGDVYMDLADTAEVPDSGPTVASRTTMVVGGLVARAARRLREELEQAGLLPAQGLRAACRANLQSRGALRVIQEYVPPPDVHWDEERFRGEAYSAYAWAVYVAGVEVDPVTCETAVTSFTAVQDIGRVVNPAAAQGQVAGGVAQGIGFALSEETLYDEGGRVLNATMANYIAPGSCDVPEIRVAFAEARPGHEPRGLGELPLDGTAPAVLNAVAEATGAEPVYAPTTPERLLELLEAEEPVRG